MTRSDTIRSEIARLQEKKATVSADLAKHERTAAVAREAARKKRDQATKTKNASTARTALAAAEREDKKVVTAEDRIAKARKDIGVVEKSIASKMKALSSAEASEKRAADAADRRADNRRRTEERAHAREIARLSTPVQAVRFVPITAPKPEKLRVLYLTANPEATEETVVDPDGTEHDYGFWLRVDQEVRQVRQQIRASKYRDMIQIEHMPAATFIDLLDGLNDHRPHIVHFSGHASAVSGLVMENEMGDEDGHNVDFALLTRALGATDTPPRLAVLNACESLSGADDLLQTVPIVIGMSDTISDVASIVFASQFYSAIASAQSVSMALEQARVRMDAASLQDSHLPELRTRDDVDPSTVILVKPLADSN
ncbi:CHAT domain-containing protein [Nocardia cyriacigeorgica]|uniref:CHAT domain-containing protein n=1 Tax=Nocardia cyriacigeorgica TaxID=135487 RepID=UPI0018937495|nr:CHAT domain-containing protein [Nocardia cyriacigeorgica]MBF6455531.1 CHAT domain-containing protein [Nocardia cyriacigeorgica]MBF6479890.1 CHAT domain-containing protein [Nocardia cyriacigeorgica]MBF6553727.1 CHAT domain-containing protein [Nocardia cyriacigeorgica]